MGKEAESIWEKRGGRIHSRARSNSGGSGGAGVEASKTSMRSFVSIAKPDPNVPEG